MSLNSTPSAERVHIGIFGKTNVGKSSIINAITGQDIAIVSDIKGTTTDPVYKAMELPPIGPVMIIDTPGLDDTGKLGKLRIQKNNQVLNKTDIAILVVNGTEGISQEDKALVEKFKQKQIPYIVVYNKLDLIAEPEPLQDINSIWVSSKTGQNINALKELIAKQKPNKDNGKKIVADLLSPGDFVVLVVHTDSSAPKGRLILPQQRTIRDILDAEAVAVVTEDKNIKQALAGLAQKPKLVITDSQVFDRASAAVPRDIPLTSFSILFARFNGDLDEMARGAKVLDRLREGDRLLICEGCTHHRQCDDIGTVKLPRWIENHTKKQFKFDFCSGTGFPDDISDYKLIIHCGGCMLTQREMQHRIATARQSVIPITNYGVLIAYINGILDRCLEPFKNKMA